MKPSAPFRVACWFGAGVLLGLNVAYMPPLMPEQPKRLMWLAPGNANVSVTNISGNHTLTIPDDDRTYVITR